VPTASVSIRAATRELLGFERVNEARGTVIDRSEYLVLTDDQLRTVPGLEIPRGMLGERQGDRSILSGPFEPTSVQYDNVVESESPQHPPETRSPGIHRSIVEYNTHAFADAVA